MRVRLIAVLFAVVAVFVGRSLAGEWPATPRIENFQRNAERWSCTADGKPLGGLMFVPAGKGPFPGIVISHGLGGSAQAMMAARGREMVRWGFVCIATDYTHAAQAGPGRGGPRGRGQEIDFSHAGARPENIRRALACVEILRQQKDVDPRRIAAYGHSMGAFLTIALLAAAPDKIKAAAITAGGVVPPGARGAAAPTTEVAAQVRVPLLILHGSADTTVPPERSELLKQALDRSGVANQRVVFEGIGHRLPDETNAADVYRLMRQWFAKYGVLPAR